MILEICGERLRGRAEIVTAGRHPCAVASEGQRAPPVVRNAIFSKGRQISTFYSRGSSILDVGCPVETSSAGDVEAQGGRVAMLHKQRLQEISRVLKEGLLQATLVAPTGRLYVPGTYQVTHILGAIIHPLAHTTLLI